MDIRSLQCSSWLSRLGLALAAAAVWSSCASGGSLGEGVERRAPPPPGPWVLMATLEDNQVPAVRITLAVDAEGNLSGDAGCNRWAGAWVWADEGLELGPFATTRKMCPPEIMESERRFLAAMARAGGWQLTDRGLVILDDSSTGLLLFNLERQ